MMKINGDNMANMKKKTILFTDSVQWDSVKKTGVSVRDGVIEYSGEELGMEPADAIFTVYRSPATIAKAAPLLVGIPLIEGHISPDDEPEPDTVEGSVTGSELIDHFAKDTNSTLAVKNQIDVVDRFTDVLESGKRELSLGYKGDLVEHDVYDFEQRDIIPRHLAVVPAGRCGSVCSFIDGKEVLMKNKRKRKLAKSFLDENGQPNMEQIVEVAQSLPDALKELPIDKLAEVMPTLQTIVEDSGVQPVIDDLNLEDEDDDEKNLTDEDQPVKKDVDLEDEDDDEEKNMVDEKTFEDAVSRALARHTEVIDKARNFLDASYKFPGKSSNQIMRDALATQYGRQQFTDSELPIAFKMLRIQPTGLQNFGDAATAKPTSLSDRLKAELGE